MPRRCVPCVIWAVALVWARPCIQVTLEFTSLNRCARLMTDTRDE